MTRDEALRKIAALHEKWSLRYGDDVPNLGGESQWQADLYAAPSIDDDLNAEIAAVLAQIDESVAQAAALTAARTPAKIIEGISDADLAAYELRAEAAMVQALQQVMDTIADRITAIEPPQ